MNKVSELINRYRTMSGLRSESTTLSCPTSPGALFSLPQAREHPTSQELVDDFHQKQPEKPGIMEFGRSRRK